MKYKNIGQIFLEENSITQQQLNLALQHQKESGLLLGTTLVKLGYLSSSDVFVALEKQKGSSCVEFLENGGSTYSDRDILTIPITIIDIITTGFNPISGGEIAQIGLLNVIGETVKDEFTVNIKTIKEIPHSTRILYGINDIDIRNAIKFKEVIPTISKYIENRPIFIFNAKYVIHFIIYYFKQLNVPFIHNDFFGLLDIWRKQYYELYKGFRSLSQLCRNYDYSLSKPYSINDSIKAIHHIFIEIMKDLEHKKNIKTISQIKEFQNRTFHLSN